MTQRSARASRVWEIAVAAVLLLGSGAKTKKARQREKIMTIALEEWKPVVGYEDLYEVSNLGRIRKKTWVVLKGADHNGGYRRVNLQKDGKHKSLFVHRLVAEAFIPNPNGYPIINHKDERPFNNRVENLEWCTQKHNVNWGTANQRRAKNSKQKSPVVGVDKKTGERVVYNSITDANEAITGRRVGGSSISEAASGKRKSAYGKYWHYKGKEDENDD